MGISSRRRRFGGGNGPTSAVVPNVTMNLVPGRHASIMDNVPSTPPAYRLQPAALLPPPVHQFSTAPTPSQGTTADVGLFPLPNFLRRDDIPMAATNNI